MMNSSGHIYAITGGSNLEHDNKRARRDFVRRVLTISPKTPIAHPAWKTTPITFSEADFRVKDFPHYDALVVTIPSTTF
jgi:hypothetical protein